MPSAYVDTVAIYNTETLSCTLQYLVIERSGHRSLTLTYAHVAMNLCSKFVHFGAG